MAVRDKFAVLIILFDCENFCIFDFSLLHSNENIHDLWYFRQLDMYFARPYV